MRIITLTTDFGLSDPFVGIMKGVILSIAPDSALVDLTHKIAAQDVLAAALALESAVEYFPPSTIHLAVVDPGVGSYRRAIAVETDSAAFVGPDNGIFTLVLAHHPARRIVSLDDSIYHLPEVNATFHGRDIFAPAAAHLAAGVPLESLGSRVEHIEQLEMPQPTFDSHSITAHVLTLDRFGNIVTDLKQPDFDQWMKGAPSESIRVRAGALEMAGIRKTYSEVASGAPVAYFGSGRRLEIGIRNGSAAEAAGATRGMVVEVMRG